MEIYITIVIIVLLFFIIQSYSYNKRERELLKKNIDYSWGKIPNREYSYEEFKKITNYYKNIIKNRKDQEYIDDITWNDLDMDTVFKKINSSWSSIGEDYLYYLLRTPVKSNKELNERNRLIKYFYSNKNTALKLEEIFANIGRTKKISLYDYIYRLKDLGTRSSFKHYIMAALLLFSIISLFYKPQFSIIFIIIMIAVNIINYMKTKAQIESYYDCFRFIVDMTINAEKILDLDIKELEIYNNTLKTSCKKISSLRKGVILLKTNNISGSFSDIILDYLRMLFHVDIIKFNSMLDKTMKNIEDINNIFETLGKIESMIAIASYRKYLEYYCEPTFNKDLNHISFKKIYHPLIENPVVNDLHVNKGVLLTGSNASGKSTFLKTVGINAILAQTINTCLASEYMTNFYTIYSSMALKDDLKNNDSYYIVEIKSLKRILDSIKSGKHVLCLIDEVLRGTNTIERIAASSQILRSLSKENVMCFAATHDIELTHLLEDYYNNYHFQEEVEENDIRFNYHLYKGRATSRNAIKLLSIIGYDKNIVEKAEKSANSFINEGIWALENN